MFDGMILEGMAVVLEEEAMITALKDNFSCTAYDYNTIFYTGDDS